MTFSIKKLAGGLAMETLIRRWVVTLISVLVERTSLPPLVDLHSPLGGRTCMAGAIPSIRTRLLGSGLGFLASLSGLGLGNLASEGGLAEGTVPPRVALL